MEKVEGKGKIKSAKTLGGKYIHEKIKKEDYRKNKKSELEEKTKKDTFLEEEKMKTEVGPFQLVVIKLPWYKKAFRKLASFLGLYYEWE